MFVVMRIEKRRFLFWKNNFLSLVLLKMNLGKLFIAKKQVEGIVGFNNATDEQKWLPGGEVHSQTK